MRRRVDGVFAGASAIDRAMGYYQVQFGEQWPERWVSDLSAADYRGLLVLRDEVVLIAWSTRYPGPVIPGASYLRAVLPPEVWEEGLYVHLAVGNLAALAGVEVPWRWLCWQRGLRSQEWHWARSVRVCDRLRGMGKC